MIYANEPIIIDENLSEKSITKNVQYFEDKSTNMTIDDIMKDDIKWIQNED